MILNEFDPILVSLGPVDLRWYGLLFATGIALNFGVLSWVFRREKLKMTILDSLSTWIFVGMIFGARLGHVFFYDWNYFSENLLEILMVWKGGLASHGAVIGMFIAYILWWKRSGGSFFKVLDLVSFTVPLTGAFVRLGNYFNSEIVGKTWDGGVVFRKLGEDFARHPVQLYESVMNLAIFGAMMWLYLKGGAKKEGRLFVWTLSLYFVGRFFAEFFKERIVLEGTLSMGQWLSVAALLVLFFGYQYTQPKKKK